jgi:hypothetical protein
MPGLRLVPAACAPPTATMPCERVGTGPPAADKASRGPAGRDRIAHRHRERGMADDRSDAATVRAVLGYLVREMEQGRPAREVLREVWAASTAVLMAARAAGRAGLAACLTSGVTCNAPRLTDRAPRPALRRARCPLCDSVSPAALRRADSRFSRKRLYAGSALLGGLKRRAENGEPNAVLGFRLSGDRGDHRSIRCRRLRLDCHRNCAGALLHLPDYLRRCSRYGESAPPRVTSQRRAPDTCNQACGP